MDDNIENLTADSWFQVVCSFEDEFSPEKECHQYWLSYSKKYKTLRRASQALMHFRRHNEGNWMSVTSGSEPARRSKMIFKIVSCIPPISQQERCRLKIYKR